MRASRSFRLAALWALFLFTSFWGEEAFALHPCPHHSAIAASGAGAASPHGSHAGGGHHSPPHHGAPSPHQGGCTCMSACAGTPLALPASGALEAVAVATSRFAPPAARAAAELPSRGRYLLPYPTAPPSVPS